MWKDLKKGHLKWREALVSQLFDTYAPQTESRKRGRPGRFDDKRNDSVELALHKKGNRGKRAHCVVCFAVKRKARKPLDEVGSRVNIEALRPRRGCLTCDVSLCPTDSCWNLFHNSKIGVV